MNEVDDDSESGGEDRGSYEYSKCDSPLSPSSQPQSPPDSPESPSPQSPPHSPLSGPQSPSSPPQSPLSAPESPSSPPLSASGHQSEDDVQVSDGEGSDNESDDHKETMHEEEEERDEDENESNEKGREQSDAEESGSEENIPEINIESADEDDDHQSEKQDVSDNEMDEAADSEDEKERESIDGNIENKSDDEADMQRSSTPSESPEKPSSAIDVAANDQQSDNDEKPTDTAVNDKADSDSDGNADSDSDAESDESEVGGLIADIFGESDDDEEFEGFNEEDIGTGKVTKETVKAKKEKKKRSAKLMSDSEDERESKEDDKEEIDEGEGIIEDLPAPPREDEPDEMEEHKKKHKVESEDSDDGDRKMREDFISDFDLMMQKKKEESSKRRRRKDVDLISDSDDLIADIISQMRQAAEEDKDLNKQKKTATKKLKILSMVMSQLKKQDLKMAFLDQGVLNVIAEWLTPLPDRSLPHLNIREGMLKQLSDFPAFDQSLLKSSGIGRALMYLYKHPKETKENREKAGKLITEWARPIFNVTTNYHSLTKEEREQRDYDHIPKKRKLKDRESSQEEEPQESRKDIEKEMSGEQKSLRPGDKGWVARARVPMPSTRDYVNRPKWNVEMEFGRGPAKKPLSRLEKHMRTLQEKKRLGKSQRAITISIEGRKMAI